jgi:type IX secretion system PorP/SprF family membrane protein
MTGMLLMGSISVQAQDPHFSQYDASPMVLNPATTGIFPGDEMRIGVNYRSQWGVLSSNIATTAVAFDMALTDRWGVGGVLVNHDLANVINSFGFVGSGSYTITEPTNKEFILSTGLQLGFIYKRTNNDELIFDSQYDGANFDNSLPTGETYLQMNRFMLDINWGFAYRMIDKTKTVKPYGGFSVFHLNLPNESLLSNEKSALPLRHVLTGGAVITPDDKWLIDPSFLVMKQRKATEINVGALAYYKLNDSFYEVLGGAYYRVGDALILHGGLKHNRNTYRVSYDLNTSPLKEFSNRRGGIEFSVVYYGRKRVKSAPSI